MVGLLGGREKGGSGLTTSELVETRDSGLGTRLLSQSEHGRSLTRPPMERKMEVRYSCRGVSRPKINNCSHGWNSMNA